MAKWVKDARRSPRREVRAWDGQLNSPRRASFRVPCASLDPQAPRDRTSPSEDDLEVVRVPAPRLAPPSPSSTQSAPTLTPESSELRLDDLELSELMDEALPSRTPRTRRVRGAALRALSTTAPQLHTARASEVPVAPEARAADLDAGLARIGVAVLHADATGRVTHLNEAAERLLARWADGDAPTLDELLQTKRPSHSDGELHEPQGEATAWVVQADGHSLAVRHMAVRGPDGGSIVVLREAQPGATLAASVARRARYDPLTGLLSRRGLVERLGQLIDESRATNQGTDGGRTHVVCYIDLDRFGLVNSTCGYDAGDDLLQWVGTRLNEVLEDGDAAARIAGDEFAIVLPGHDLREAERKARDVQQRLAEFRFARGDKTFLVKSSLGLFPFGAEAEGGDAVLSAASHACRMAKKSGGGRIQTYLESDQLIAQSRRSIDWVAGIQHHLAAGRIQLYAQTIHPFGGRGEEGGHFEVLMRVLDDQGRRASPVGIIEAAENGRVMDTIDRFVLRKTFQTIGRLPRSAQRRLDMCSVNLSAISLAREGMLDFIVEELERSSIPPGKICFEITETTALNNLDEVRWFIQELGAMGCRFAIDDFGSGHASYGYLERLLVDYVKIDGLFVKDMMTNAVHRAIVESVNRIATTLGIKTIAECVETQEAADVLDGMGIHYGQGWHFAKPEPLGEVCGGLDAE